VLFIPVKSELQRYIIYVNLANSFLKKLHFFHFKK